MSQLKVNSIIPVGGVPTGGGGGIVKIISVSDSIRESTGSFLFTDSYTDTPFTVDITPSSTSNKILLLATGSVGIATTTPSCAFRFTENDAAVGIGDPSSSRDRASFKIQSSSLNASQNFVGSCILSPNSTSTLTYRVQIEADAEGSFAVNRSFNLSNSTDSSHAVTSSYLHVFELDGSNVTIST